MEEMAGMLGGRVAEEITFGDVTTGASNDLERVTQMARAMVTRYGMSPKLGPMTFGEREELIFLGREISEQRNYSEDVAELIDAEVRAIVDEAYANARRVLDANQDKLGVLAEALMEKETMGREEFVALMEGNPPPTPTRPSPPKPSGQQRTTPTEGDDLASGDISFSPAPA
jgi:cell division protease FtsH